MGTISKENLFTPELVSEFINQTKGSSAIAKICGASPIPFNGQKEFTFTLDKDVDIVAENGKKSSGGATIGVKTIIPIKIEYGCRISDEFKYASEEVQLDYMKAFIEGFANKVARGLDLMAIHGVNPRTSQPSSVIGTNNFSSAISNVITFSNGDKPDEKIEAAIEKVQENEIEVNGLIMSTSYRSKLASQTSDTGARLYPELGWVNNPGNINGLRTEVTPNISANSSLNRVLLGDFQNSFRWGYAKDIFVKMIEYGIPDNDLELGDLQGHNQVYLRGEAYIGWGILDEKAFAFVKADE